MYIYLFFIFLGILLYILLNNYNTFSVGIPTYNIQSKNPGVVFTPAPEFTGNTVTDASVIINDQRLSLREYIESQDDSDFPGGYTNYVLVRNDSPEVEEGEPPCPVEEGMLTQFDCYRAQLLSLSVDETLTNYIISQVEQQVEQSELILSEKRLRLACATNQRLAELSPLFTTKSMDAHLLHSIAIELDETREQLWKQLWGNHSLGFGLDSYTDYEFYEFNEYVDMNILLRILENFHSPVDLPGNLIQLMNNLTPIIIQLLRLGLNYDQIINLLNIVGFDELETILNINLLNEQIDYDGIKKLTLYYYIYHTSILTSVLSIDELNRMTIEELLNTFEQIMLEQYESSDSEDDVELFSDPTDPTDP